MNHKYLEELNLPADSGHFYQFEPAFYSERLQKEKETYGFDSRETIDMDVTFMLWLYEHLRMYVDTAKDIVNLGYPNRCEYEGKKYTQLELIKKMLDGIKRYFAAENDKEAYAELREVANIWAYILPFMWW